MRIYSILASVTTVISFALFIGIVLWAYSRRRRDAFRDAALAPFAVPDESDPCDLEVRAMSAQGPSAGASKYYPRKVVQ